MKRAEIGETNGRVHVASNSPRPLQQTLDALQQKYGWTINYEDPRYISRLDVVEAPDEQKTTRIPAGGDFSADFVAPAKDSTKDEEKTLRGILDSYNHSQNPGRFELRISPQGDLDVVGVAAHDAKGEISQQEVLFDLPVTFPNKERTIIETIELICNQLTERSHFTVAAGVYPRSTIGHASIVLGGDKTPARQLLRQCLQSTKRKLHWRLLFDPESNSYFLNVHSQPN